MRVISFLFEQTGFQDSPPFRRIFPGSDLIANIKGAADIRGQHPPQWRRDTSKTCVPLSFTWGNEWQVLPFLWEYPLANFG